jgi:hypothetical protein
MGEIVCHPKILRRGIRKMLWQKAEKINTYNGFSDKHFTSEAEGRKSSEGKISLMVEKAYSKLSGMDKQWGW